MPWEAPFREALRMAFNDSDASDVTEFVDDMVKRIREMDPEIRLLGILAVLQSLIQKASPPSMFTKERVEHNRRLLGQLFKGGT